MRFDLYYKPKQRKTRDSEINFPYPNLSFTAIKQKVNGIFMHIRNTTKTYNPKQYKTRDSGINFPYPNLSFHSNQAESKCNSYAYQKHNKNSDNQNLEVVLFHPTVSIQINLKINRQNKNNLIILNNIILFTGFLHCFGHRKPRPQVIHFPGIQTI